MAKFVDTHNHSQFSPDSSATVLTLAEHARSLGAAGITITDHIDLDAPREKDKFLFSIAEQQAEIERVAKIMGGDFKVLKGIELGLQPESVEHTRQFVQGYSFDQVVASVHFVDGLDPYLGTYYEDKDYHEAFGRMLEVIYQTARDFEDFDVIGHFDYVARYAPYEVKDIWYEDFPDHLDTLLKFLAREGKALEINTKTYAWHGVHLQVLDLNILRRFRELGGEFVTLGSDSHDDKRVCENFEKYASILEDCGFEYLTYFENRKPVLYPIV